ncbi:MAG: class I SAM-dependent methyltransferase, partial [Thermomicrobiales bacterium]|nr:class I SAM-dependent methyltransferase [Thermomicrobiales bacterium]
SGGSTLHPEELELAGNVTGRRLLHLQCNCGQDTLSFARLGADVTGVDISDAAIEVARQLSADAGIPGAFHRDDVYDWLAAATERGEQFDIVFSSYGAICWLSDLSTWAKGIATVLKPGGRFALVEFHPSLQALEEGWTPRYNAIGGQREDWSEGIGDYVGFMGDTLAPAGSGTGVVDFKNPEPSVEFAWSVAEVVTALLDAGLELRTLREYPYSNGFTPFHGFKELPGRRFTTPDDRPNIPMMYGVMATKPAG